MTTVLVGGTGYVGSTLSGQRDFDIEVHRSNIEDISGLNAKLVVCAGLPAAKYIANRDPMGDWSNMTRLASVLATTTVDEFILISTIDVYQPPIGVDEFDAPAWAGPEAYGVNRLWFELFVRATFAKTRILRLPGLFGPRLRKNLVFDLLSGRSDHYAKADPSSLFQFFDVTTLWDLIDAVREADLDLLNVSSEPVTAQEVATLFGVSLTPDGTRAIYDIRSVHAALFGGTDGYLVPASSQLDGISDLRDSWGAH